MAAATYCQGARRGDRYCKRRQGNFQKGYGYSDVTKETPVTSDGALFRIGSVSKLFTWTAMMQLVDRREVNLDQDVNHYLDFKIPATCAKPVTVRNRGFNEVAKDFMVKEAKDLRPLGEYLKLYMPARICPPGTIPAYSNYGATLASLHCSARCQAAFRRIRGAAYFAALEYGHFPAASPAGSEATHVEWLHGFVTALDSV